MKSGLARHELVFFDYWMTMFELLKLGLPWDVINNLSVQDMAYVIGFHQARMERENEQRAEMEAKSLSRY